MSMVYCTCRCRCPLAAVIVSVILGVVAAILQVTGTITVAPAFLWAAFGIAVVYLGGLAVLTAVRPMESDPCARTTLNTLLAGILGTILFALVLLAVGIVATSVLSAILVGILVAFFFLMITATACLVRLRAGYSCGE